jgi:tRNA dimethylallyltransferase
VPGHLRSGLDAGAQVATLTAVQAWCLAGPTAAGKTDVALALAERLASVAPLEVVSMDSALVYRGMDIGTAKPSSSERARVPHHLIDVLDPSQAYSAARFLADAQRLVAQITARGHTPLIVGGTLLYYKALCDGLHAMPSSDPALRAQLDAEAAARGWPAMHAELAQVDPRTAARLPPNDAQRIQRALEVWRLTGRALSAWHSDTVAQSPPGAWPLLSLEPESRAWLHARIAARFGQMLAQGFVDEVRQLRARGDLHIGLPAMRCVGYRQAWVALDAGQDANDARWHDQAIAATRQLAKRQLTWLRSVPARQVVACDHAGAAEQAVKTLFNVILKAHGKAGSRAGD